MDPSSRRIWRNLWAYLILIIKFIKNLLKKMKPKKIPYTFELHTTRLLREFEMTARDLYPAWRKMPESLGKLKYHYHRNPSQKNLNFLMKKDHIMYNSILTMIETRTKRVSNLKFELLLKKHNFLMSYFKFIKMPLETSKLEVLKKEFIRTGKIIYITEIRKLDNELTENIKKIISKKKSKA